MVNKYRRVHMQNIYFSAILHTCYTKKKHNTHSNRWNITDFQRFTGKRRYCSNVLIAKKKKKKRKKNQIINLKSNCYFFWLYFITY